MSSATFSVVTPSYNQAEYLPECLSSVASQAGVIEHLVFDPGSDDGSRDIAAAANQVTLIAEPDDGQADAVGRGLSQSRGDIIAWLNSDDIYIDADVFADVAVRFAAADRPDIVYCDGNYIERDGTALREAYVNKRPETLPDRLQHEVGILQPGLFMRRSVVETIGIPDAALRFAMDYDYWIRAVKAGLKFAYLERVVAGARYYADNKTMGQRGASYTEAIDVAYRHFGYAHSRWAQRLAEFNVDAFDGILVESANAESNERATRVERDNILIAYNHPWAARQHIQTNAKRQPVKETAEALVGTGLIDATPYRPLAVGEARQEDEREYTVDGQRWGFESAFVGHQLARSDQRLAELAASRSSDTCIIAGNGPSLNATDMNLLDETDVFVTNYAHLKPDLFARAKYLSVVNNLVAEQEAPMFNQLQGVTMIFPWWLLYCLAPRASMLFVRSIGYPIFSHNIFENVSWRHTVSFFSMQLAWGLGYRRIGLIGFDHSYRQNESFAEGDTIEQRGDDANHFSAEYFKAKKWHAADVDNMEAMYVLADQAVRSGGGEIVNCTVGGHLDLFPRNDLGTFLASAGDRS